MQIRKRVCGLLLAPAALGLLASIIGAGRVGLAAASSFPVIGGLSLSVAVVLARRPDRPRMWWSFLRWVAVAALMVVPMGFLFGPSGGFHHHIGFGPFWFFYIVWNGEDSEPGVSRSWRGTRSGSTP